MKKQLFIPEKICVGYQERSDTFTKKLAYVIYWDQKGKLRKETSWNSWRDSKISPDEFENVPTSGFVLNKGVGGVRQSYGWNPRNEYIRIYDPRGVEFEISVPNLMFIMMNTDINRRELQGEFVYSWDGTELVLLPVDTTEYKESTTFTRLQDKKVSARDLIVGMTYESKKQKHWVYLGRHDWYILDEKTTSYRQKNYPYRYVSSSEYTYKAKKRHVFGRISGKSVSIKATNSMTWLARELTESDDLGKCLSALKRDTHIAKPVRFYVKPTEYKEKKSSGWSYETFYKEINPGEFHGLNVRTKYDYEYQEDGTYKPTLTRFTVNSTYGQILDFEDLSRMDTHISLPEYSQEFRTIEELNEYLRDNKYGEIYYDTESAEEIKFNSLYYFKS